MLGGCVGGLLRSFSNRLVKDLSQMVWIGMLLFGLKGILTV